MRCKDKEMRGMIKGFVMWSEGVYQRDICRGTNGQCHAEPVEASSKIFKFSFNSPLERGNGCVFIMALPALRLGRAIHYKSSPPSADAGFSFLSLRDLFD